MIQFKLTFDKDLEQEWLNNFCQEGWAMTGFAAGFFTFTPCQPGEYIYQINLLPGDGFKAKDVSEYVEFMEETGVEIVQRWFRWVFLRKRAADGPFQIYTDIDSQIQMYRRIRQMFLWALVLECFCSLSIWLNVAFNDSLLIRCMAAVFVMIIVAFVRAVCRCSRIIQELERQK